MAWPESDPGSGFQLDAEPRGPRGSTYAESMAADQDLHQHIKALVDEERRLRSARAAGAVQADEENTRIRAIETELDRCWDLLRQREALRESGRNPDEATVRPADQVEGYLG